MSDPPHGPPTGELLAHAEHNLSQATYRLGRLRSRNRGSGLHRDLTAIFYDVQAARQAIIAILNADEPEAQENEPTEP